MLLNRIDEFRWRREFESASRGRDLYYYRDVSGFSRPFQHSLLITDKKRDKISIGTYHLFNVGTGFYMITIDVFVGDDMEKSEKLLNLFAELKTKRIESKILDLSGTIFGVALTSINSILQYIANQITLETLKFSGKTFPTYSVKNFETSISDNNKKRGKIFTQKTLWMELEKLNSSAIVPDHLIAAVFKSCPGIKGPFIVPNVKKQLQACLKEEGFHGDDKFPGFLKIEKGDAFIDCTPYIMVDVQNRFIDEHETIFDEIVSGDISELLQWRFRLSQLRHYSLFIPNVDADKMSDLLKGISQLENIRTLYIECDSWNHRCGDSFHRLMLSHKSLSLVEILLTGNRIEVDVSGNVFNLIETETSYLRSLFNRGRPQRRVKMIFCHMIL